MEDEVKQPIPAKEEEVVERAEQVPFADLITQFVKTGFKPEEMDKVFERKEGTCRSRLRYEFALTKPVTEKMKGDDGKVKVKAKKDKDGNTVLEPNPAGENLRKGLVGKIRAKYGEEKAVECESAIESLFTDLRIGGSGRKIDKEAIIADLDFDMV